MRVVVIWRLFVVRRVRQRGCLVCRWRNAATLRLYWVGKVWLGWVRKLTGVPLHRVGGLAGVPLHCVGEGDVTLSRVGWGRLRGD